jgi:DNA repair photolyase
MLTADRLKYKWYKKRTGTIWAPGIKMWSNGIPLKADTYQSCMNFCKYCYAEELRKGILARVGMAQDSRVSRMLDVAWLAKFFEKAYQHDDKSPFMNWSIRNKYFIEVGTTGETFQEADTYFRTTYNFLKLTSYYKMPLFINTKMNLLCNNEQYFNMLRDYPAPVIICLTLTTTDDEDGRKFEPGAPLPSERLRVIKELSKHNVSTIVYTSPYMPGVTDKDMDKYAGDLLDAGIVGVHLRDFFVQGDRFKNSFWQEYMKLNKQHYAPFPGGHHVKYSRRRWFMEELQKRVEKRDPNFKVVGVKSAWFELNPFHGKMCYDYLPEDFKKGITDWTAIPMMRKIRDNVNTPQLLLWEKLGYKRNMINYPEYIRTNEGDINNLTVGRYSNTSLRHIY